MLAAASIKAGDGEVYVAGGMESMNGAPFLLRKARFGYRLGNGTLDDSAVLDGLWCSVEDCHMGTHAERVAISNDVSPRGPGRVRAREPPAGGRGARRRPVRRRAGAGHGPRREGPRDGRRPSTRARAATRRSRRSRGWRRCSTCPTGEDRGDATVGTVTAGNAPGITDGAAATSSPRSGRSSSTACGRSPGSSATRRPRSRPSGCSSRRSRASAPSRPDRAVARDFDLVEINEAFAAQTLADGRELGFDWDEGQRERRRDRARAPDRGVRRADRRDAAPRAGAPRGPLRARDAVPRRRRLGRDGLRAGLAARLLVQALREPAGADAAAGRHERLAAVAVAISHAACHGWRTRSRPSRASTAAPPRAWSAADRRSLRVDRRSTRDRIRHARHRRHAACRSLPPRAA